MAHPHYPGAAVSANLNVAIFCDGCGRQAPFYRPPGFSTRWACSDCDRAGHDHTARLRGACVAFTRFAVWCALEAKYRSWADLFPSPGELYLRSELLGHAVREGHLRLTFGDDR